MKRSSKDAGLDQLIRAARTDVPTPALLEELKALAVLGKAAPDVAASVASSKSSLGIAAGASGKANGLLGTVAVKAGVGLVALSIAAAGGLFLMRARLAAPSHAEKTAEVPTPQSAGKIELGRPAPGEVSPLQDDEVRGREQATLPLPPVFDQASEPPSPARAPLDRETTVSASNLSGSKRVRVEPRSQGFLAEARMVDEARRALRTNAEAALRLTEQCAREFPNGGAATERSVIAIEALVRLGREAEARERLSRFEQAHPNSFHLPYLRRLLGDRGE